MEYKEKYLELIEKILDQAERTFKLIQLQYPSENWLDLTESEKNILLWFNDIEQEYLKELEERIIN